MDFHVSINDPRIARDMQRFWKSYQLLYRNASGVGPNAAVDHPKLAEWYDWMGDGNGLSILLGRRRDYIQHGTHQHVHAHQCGQLLHDQCSWRRAHVEIQLQRRNEGCDAVSS